MELRLFGIEAAVHGVLGFTLNLKEP